MFKFKHSGLVELDVGPDGCLALTFRKGEVSTGNLTGQQLRAVHCLEQLHALLDDRLYPLVKQIAEASPDELESIISYIIDGEADHENGSFTTPGDYLKTISAMAIFCHTEIVERGLRITP